MFTISPISQDQVQKLIDNLKVHGSTVELRSGQYVIAGHGIIAMAKVEQNEMKSISSLSVNVTRKPFFVSMKMIEDGLHDVIGPIPTATPLIAS